MFPRGWGQSRVRLRGTSPAFAGNVGASETFALAREGEQDVDVPVLTPDRTRCRRVVRGAQRVTGAFNPANAANAASGSHEHAHPSKPMNRTFDVTQALQQFAAQQQDQISVVIEAGNGREGDTSPAVRNENARMQIKSIELMR